MPGNHLPVHIQKLMRQVSLRCHNYLQRKLAWQFRKVLSKSLQLDEAGCQELCTLAKCFNDIISSTKTIIRD